MLSQTGMDTARRTERERKIKEFERGGIDSDYSLIPRLESVGVERTTWVLVSLSLSGVGLGYET